MAKKWSEVIASPQYQALPPEERMAAKQEYFQTVVTMKPEYQQLPPEEKIAAQQEFFNTEDSLPIPQRQRQSIYSTTINSKGGVSIRETPYALSPQAKADIKTKSINEQITADIKNKAFDFRQAKPYITSVMKMSDGLEGGYSGLKEIVKSKINRGKGESSKYMTYLDNLPAASVALYRSITGDTRLSDADAQSRAYPLLWHPSQDKDVKKKKEDFINSLLTARETLLTQGKYQVNKETGEQLTPMEDVSRLAEKIQKAKERGISEKEIMEYLKGKNVK